MISTEDEEQNAEVVDVPAVPTMSAAAMVEVREMQLELCDGLPQYQRAVDRVFQKLSRLSGEPRRDYQILVDVQLSIAELPDYPTAGEEVASLMLRLSTAAQKVAQLIRAGDLEEAAEAVDEIRSVLLDSVFIRDLANLKCKGILE